MTPTETLVRRDRAIVLLGMALICLLSWYYLLLGAGTGMDTLAMTTLQFPLPAYHSTGGHWSVTYFLILLIMWWVMMIAMMLPSAAPMILLYARVYRHHHNQHSAIAPTAAFLYGYLAAWLFFSFAATALHWLLEWLGLVDGMMMWSSSHLMSGTFLVLTGIYQFSSLKQNCLAHCQSPASYLSSHWRDGHVGAFSIGVKHGFYCVGCCWSLMLLLFVGGVMNLFWIAGLAVFVLLEKVTQQSRLFTRVSGILMIVTGAYLLLP